MSRPQDIGRTPSLVGPSLSLLLLALLLLGSPCAGASRLFPITTSLGINETAASEDEADRPANATMRCDEARLRCAYRTGCGHALQHYMSRCAAVLHSDASVCPEYCQYALIGLMSTDEGKELMTCECAKNDGMCEQSKKRVEVCRASVMAKMNRTRVSCRVATWICNADALCSTALQYYNENCKRMFTGKKCTKRCHNSINILRRQEKAAKLNTCFCDGAEEYDCIAIHRNMDVLCFNLPAQHHKYREEPEAEAGVGGAGTTEEDGYGRRPEDTRPNEAPSRAAKVAGSESWRILLLGLVLLLHPVARGE